MSLTYGFYNSKNGDRKYDAVQLSSIFDGIILDGVFQHIGSAFVVKATTGMVITVGTGRAWFNHTWTLNDDELSIILSNSEPVLNRIDAVVLEIDTRESARKNSIKVIKGVPASTPKNPTLIKSGGIWQYPLAYVRVNAAVTAITQANITNTIGTSSCPYVMAPLDRISISSMVAQWQSEWELWLHEKMATFESWFKNLNASLDKEVAAKLAADILDLKNRFDALDAEQKIYKTITDSSGRNIEDNYGSDLNSTTLYSKE